MLTDTEIDTLIREVQVSLAGKDGKQVTAKFFGARVSTIERWIETREFPERAAEKARMVGILPKVGC